MLFEGAFNGTNGSIIDTHINPERTSAVIIHEFVHYELGTTTTYGQLLLMLHKNILLDDRAQRLYNELFSHVYRMQERAAVNVELLSQYDINGEESYYHAVEDLKEKNRTYYGYFRKLCCVNGQVGSTLDASAAIRIIQAISRWAMNINLDQIPFDKFLTEKDVQHFFSINSNNIKYNPNKRFDILVNCFFRSAEDVIKLDADIGEVLQGSLPQEDSYNITVIHQKAKNAAIKIYNTSPIKERLIRRIETIGIKQNAIKQDGGEYLTILPIDMNKVTPESRFIKLDLENFIAQLDKEQHREITVLHQFRGFEDYYFCTIQSNDAMPITYILPISNKYDFLNTLQTLKCRAIFMQSKIIVDLHKSLKRVVGQLPIFIYYDTPIINAIDFLKSFYRGGQYYIQEKTGYLLVVVHKRSFFTILNAVYDARNILEMILQDADIKLSTEPSCMVDIERINENMRSRLRVP